VTAERSFLRHLEGNCQVPFGVYGDISGGMLSLEGTILSVDGKISIREKLSGYRHEAEKLGIELAEKLASQGGQEIIESFRKKE
jgi:hydroxymethylbilane synthase